jgi:hypothetical protein
MTQDDKTKHDDKAASEHLQDIGSKAADEAGTAGGEATTGAGGLRSGVQRGGTTPGGGPGAGLGSMGTGGASTGGSDTGNVKRGGK